MKLLILADFFWLGIALLDWKSEMRTLKGCGCKVAVEDGPSPLAPQLIRSFPAVKNLFGEKGLRAYCF
jgi:hypothetical protein